MEKEKQLADLSLGTPEKSHEFEVLNADTDSISFCKRDGGEINAEEQKALLDEINNLMPERFVWEHDGYFSCVICFKAKNYVLYDGKKIKTKGSALKDQKKEKAIKEFQSSMIQYIIDGREDFLDLYHQYVKEIMDVKDISRWSSKKSISKAVLESPRTNEQKVRDAIAGTEYREGDRIYVFFKEDESLCLQENFQGDYNKLKLLEKLHKASELFKDVLPQQKEFIKYFQKRQQAKLAELP